MPAPGRFSPGIIDYEQMSEPYLRKRINSLQDAYRRRHALRVVPRDRSRAQGA